jgi:Helix-turn-helix domain
MTLRGRKLALTPVAAQNHGELDCKPTGTTMSAESTVGLEFEHFIDAETAAAFLAIEPRRIKAMARAGELPAHSLGKGKRKTWRFRRSELAAAVTSTNGQGTRSKVVSQTPIFEGTVASGSPVANKRRS